MDLDLLSSLPPRQMRAGYGEVVKYAVLGDRPFFDWLEQSGADVLAGQPAALHKAVATSIAMKAAIVAEDELETGNRALLNLGHTFGHALEAFAGYSDRLLHGEAVAIGLCLATQFSEDLGFCTGGSAVRVRSHLANLGLPTAIRDMPGSLPTAAECLALMMQDKKIKSGQLTFVLLRDLGDAFVARDIPHDTVLAFLNRALGPARADAH